MANLNGHEAENGGHSQGKPKGSAPFLDPTTIAVGFLSVLAGLIAGAAIVMKLHLLSPPYPAMAVVDLSKVVERQRALILKEGGDPDMAEQKVGKRMLRLAEILAELGQRQVILNKPAVVSGRLPDLTAVVEERLSERE
jgi:hypothetical protein